MRKIRCRDRDRRRQSGDDDAGQTKESAHVLFYSHSQGQPALVDEKRDLPGADRRNQEFVALGRGLYFIRRIASKAPVDEPYGGMSIK